MNMPIKFSVLLPTRNRLHYLKYAVASVLAQGYTHWEIIISDNASEEDIRGYVDSLRDERIRYFRTREFISVTENWNHALNQATGDYVIMLGDDDILLKGYFSKMIELLKQHDLPPLIYANAYIYTYPGVIPQKPEGQVQTCGHYLIFENAKEPFWLTKEKVLTLVQGHMDFRAHFGTNMQFVLVQHNLIKKLKINHQFFHSPYPDVYAMSVLLLEAERILAYPKEMAVIGVTPKSTGNFLLNSQEKKGMEFLNIAAEIASLKSLSHVILPGSYSLTCWLVAVEHVKMNSANKDSLNVNYQRYRLLQIEQAVKKYFSQERAEVKSSLVVLFKMINLKEKFLHFMPLFFSHATKKFSPRFLKRMLGKIYDRIFAVSSVAGDRYLKKNFSNIFEIFESIEKEKSV